MKNTNRLLLLAILLNGISAHASILVYNDDEAGRQMAIGADADPENPDSFQIYVCESPQGRMIPQGQMIVDLQKQKGRVRCNKITSEPIPYQKIPEAAIQAYQDWKTLLDDPALLKRFKDEVQKKIAEKALKDWHLSKDHFYLRARVGNTEYALQWKKDIPLDVYLPMLLQNLEHNLLNPGSPYYADKLPKMFRDAVRSPGRGITNSPVDFYIRAEVYADIARMAGSQIDNNEECRALLSEVGLYHDNLEASFGTALEFDATEEKLLALAAALARAQDANKIKNPRRFEGMRLTPGNLCYQWLLHAHRTLGKGAETDEKTLKEFASPELAAKYKELTQGELRERIEAPMLRPAR